MDKPSSDPRELRSALGKFATGVTIVTTSDADGAPVGVTANSFNSVSLDPPMVLWSLSNSSRSLPAFARGGEFAVHILSAKQEELSARFASKGADKFAGLAFERGPGGAPLLDGCVARFRCRTAHQYAGGDHTIFVGEVLDYAHEEGPPLLFHSGRYAETRERSKEGATPGIDLDAGRFTADFLPLLLSRAARQVSRPVRQSLAEMAMTESEHLTLSLLSMHGALYLDEIYARLRPIEQMPEPAMIEAMQRAGLLRQGSLDDPLHITEAGRDRFLFVLARAKARDDDLRERFSPAEMADFTRLLKKLIEATLDDA